MLFRELILTYKRRAEEAQSVTTRAVNPGVVSSDPSSVNILSDFWQKSLWQAPFVFLSMS